MEQLFVNWFLVFTRAGAMLSVFPLFSASAVPVRLRIALAGFISFLIMPTLGASPVDPLNETLLSLVGLLLKEVAIGLLMGWLCRLMSFAMALAGHFISSQIGLQLGGMIAPGEEHPTETVGIILQMLAIMLLLTMDMHYALLIGFQQSYHVLPVGAGMLSEQLFDDVTMIAGRTFFVAVKIAAPIIAVGIVVNLLLCMLARAVPQINVFMESFGIRLLIGILLLGSVFNLASHEIAVYLNRLPVDFTNVVQLLAGG